MAPAARWCRFLFHLSHQFVPGLPIDGHTYPHICTYTRLQSWPVSASLCLFGLSRWLVVFLFQFNFGFEALVTLPVCVSDALLCVCLCVCMCVVSLCVCVYVLMHEFVSKIELDWRSERAAADLIAFACLLLLHVACWMWHAAVAGSSCGQ